MAGLVMVGFIRGGGVDVGEDALCAVERGPQELVCTDWRGDTDEAGSTSLPTSELVSIRRPLIEAAEQ